MSETVVKISNLVKRYKELIALDNFSLEIKKGEIFGLLGPNGSGKTTTINCLLSLLKYDKGEVQLFGEKMGPNRRDLKKRIGVVCQNDLNDFRKFYPKKLSGGLLRRLNIACGIAHKPDLIILDEPTVAVDPQSRNKILEGVIELNKNGATIIYTSHYMEEIEQICSKILIMDKGKEVASGTSEELKGKIKNTENVIVDIRKLPAEHIEAIKKLNHVYDVQYMSDKLTIKCNGGKHNITHVIEYLSENNVNYERIYSELPTLNDVFLEITGKELRDKD